ncbi:MAG TPA: HAD family phosphatase [Thermoanaerobacterales bacterium]|nr:HAD family phosphatase [Thermoanaerobacterales bacterium]
MAIRLVTIDIDGTLIRDDLTVSQKTVEKIKKVMEKNVMVTLCTGRPNIAAKYFAEMLGIEGYQISQNGAYIKHNITGNIILHDTLPRGIAEKIILICREHKNFSLSLLYEDICYYETLDELAMHVNLNINLVKPIRVDDINELIWKERKNPTKILVTGQARDLDSFMRYLIRLYGSQVNILRSGAQFLDIISAKASKGRALKVLSEKLKIQRQEIMAIGDNFNDIDMIEFAGIGVAMGNAPDEVKKIADFIASSNNNDGVADALEEFIL